MEVAPKRGRDRERRAFNWCWKMVVGLHWLVTNGEGKCFCSFRKCPHDKFIGALNYEELHWKGSPEDVGIEIKQQVQI